MTPQRDSRSDPEAAVQDTTPQQEDPAAKLLPPPPQPSPPHTTSPQLPPHTAVTTMTPALDRKPVDKMPAGGDRMVWMSTAPPDVAAAANGDGEGNKGAAGMAMWDSDAARLLKMVDTENLDGLQALLATGVHVNGHGGTFHETALHRAAQIRWSAGVRFLLAAGASVYAKNQFGQTPLHYAAASKSTTCIELLLEYRRPGVVDHRDMRGHTPLHDAAATGCVNALSLLLKAGAQVIAKDGTGSTPLHKAARARSVPCMVALLNAGADMAAADDNGETVLAYTLHYLPGLMDTVFDECLVTNSPKINTKTLEVTMNFLPLCYGSDKNQVQNLQSFVDMGHAKLLSHPLCETFLLLKWMNVRRLFLIEVTLYLLFAVLTTVLTFNKFVWNAVDVNNETLLSLNSDTEELCRNAIRSMPEGVDQVKITFNKFMWSAVYVNNEMQFSLDNETENMCKKGIRRMSDGTNQVVRGIVVTYLVIIMLQQVLSMLQNKLQWFRSLSAVLHVVITLLVAVVVLPSVVEDWHKHLAAWLMLLLWTECMLLIGRFPNCGVYVVMFTRVAKVFLRIFLMYFCLLLAFSAAFYVALNSNLGCAQDDSVLANPLYTFIKTLTMMIGELDFSPEFVDGLSQLTVTGHVIFLLFIILVSIILSNLLVALAVSDVQGLRNSAHLERLIKQTELVFHMEKNFSTAEYIAEHIKVTKIANLLMKIPSVCRYDCLNTKVLYLPNSPLKSNKLIIIKNKKVKETTVPSYLLANVNQCLRGREADQGGSGGETGRSTRARRGSRIRRGDYQRSEANNDEVKAGLKELEANVIEMVTDRIDEMKDTYTGLSKQMEDLEEKLLSITNLLSKQLKKKKKDEETEEEEEEDEKEDEEEKESGTGGGRGRFSGGFSGRRGGRGGGAGRGGGHRRLSGPQLSLPGEMIT